MTVAIVGTDMAPVQPGAGGIENLLWGWSNRLSQSREVVVLSVPSKIPTESTEQFRIKTFTNTHDCRRILDAIGPDVVITNNRPLVGDGFNQVALLHNRFPAWRDPAYDRWEGGGDECAPALERATSVVTVSDFLAQEVRNRIERSVEVVHPFAADAFFVSGQTSRSPKDGVVRYIGRLLEKKGVRTVLALAQRMPDVAFELTNFISPWTSPTEEHRRLRAEASDIANVTVIEPPPTVDALAALMARSSLILVPSVWDEPFGLVSIEAQATGSTVLVNKVGGLPETVVSDEYVVDFSNLKLIEDRVRQYLNDPVAHQTLSSQVARRYSLEASTKELSAIIDDAGKRSESP